MRQLGRRVEALHPAGHQPPQALPVGADPKLSPAALGQHTDVGAAGGSRRQEGIAAHPLFQLAESGDGADPDRSVAGLANRAYAVVGQILGGVIVGGLVPVGLVQVEDQQAAPADQQASLAILPDGMHRHGRHTANAVNAHQRFLLHAKQAGVGAHPESAAIVFEDDAHKPVGEPLRDAVRAEPAIPVADQAAAFAADPQAAVLGSVQAIHAVIAEGRLVLVIEHREPCTVEAYQSAAGADPQVTVRRLCQRLRIVFRQPVGTLPDAAAVDRRIGRAIGGGGRGEE